MPDDFERYNRNILVPQIGTEGQKKLLNTRVLVCGAGGLASGVISNLSSLGVGHIGIVDNDVVELSNLNRQYIHKLSALGAQKVESAKAWIEAYNKDIDVKTYSVRLAEDNYAEIVAGYDIIVDCFDSFESKFLLNDIALKTGKPLVHAGVSEFSGQVMTILPKETACLRCIMGNADTNAYTAKGVVSPAVSLIASIESMEILKLALSLGNKTPEIPEAPDNNSDSAAFSLLTDKILVVDGLKMTFKTLNISKAKNCKCGTD